MPRSIKRLMSRLNWNRLGFFLLGSFFGSYFLGAVAGLFGRRG